MTSELRWWGFLKRANFILGVWLCHCDPQKSDPLRPLRFPTHGPQPNQPNQHTNQRQPTTPTNNQPPSTDVTSTTNTTPSSQTGANLSNYYNLIKSRKQQHHAKQARKQE